MRPLRHSRTPLRHSCAPVPAPPSVIPAQAPSVIPAPPPSFPRPLRHSCAGRNPGEPARFENGADAGRPPAGPSAPLRPPSVIPAQAGIQASQVRSRTAPMLDGLPQVRAPPSVIPAQAGIQASWVGSRTAPMLDGLPQVRAPPPSFLRPSPLRHSCAGRNPGELVVRERRRCWTASGRSERPLRRLGGPSAGWRRRADLGGRLDSCLRRNDGGGRTE